MKKMNQYLLVRSKKLFLTLTNPNQFMNMRKTHNGM